LGDIEPAALELLHQHLEWVTIAGGQTLMTQGEPGDSMYLMISGRVRAYVLGDDGVERLVREMARGQIIGEMSLYTDEPRSASVVAIRDSVLVRLGKPAFNDLLASSDSFRRSLQIHLGLAAAGHAMQEHELFLPQPVRFMEIP
jgi:NTE family protein